MKTGRITLDNNSEWPLPRTEPGEVGISSERLAKLGPAMQRFIDQKQIPNVITLVAREGKIVHFEAQGYLDCTSKSPALKNSIYRLYSDTKPITGVAVMILCEEGLLNLNDPVSRYIPAFKNPMVTMISPVIRNRFGPPYMSLTIPAGREITIRDCLANTSGLATPRRSPYWLRLKYKEFIDELGWDIPESLDVPPRTSYSAMVEANAMIPLSFEPGTEFVYHVGYSVIGVIIEKITGKTLEDYFQERIFKPLAMKDTSFYLDKKKLKRFTTCYETSFNNSKWSLSVHDKPETSEKVNGPKIYFSAGGDMGGVLSTAVDYARLVQMLLNNGQLDGKRILSRKSVEIMTSDHTGNIVIPMFEPGFGFGIGVGVYQGGSPLPVLRSPGTFGWGGSAGTTFFADPKEKLLALCFTQTFGGLAMSGNNYLGEFERLVYESLI
jgi:CubicO group peptidase (beta-lactamase class C family)